MKRILLAPALAMVLLACGGGPKTEAKKAMKPPMDPAEAVAGTRLFTGEDGIRAQVVELKGGEKAFIKVTGSRSEVEGKVLEHEIREDGRRLSYITQIRGRDRYTLVRTKPLRGGKSQWKLYLGAKYPNGVKVSFDEEGSPNVPGAKIYTEHYAQRGEGSLAKLQEFNRKDEEAEEEKELAEKAAFLAKKCKLQVKVAVKWDGISDDDLKKYSISSYCGNALDAMRDLCEDNDMARAYLKQNIRKMECRLGGERSFKVAKGALAWSESFEGTNSRQFARKSLLEQDYKGKTLQYQLALSETRVCGDSEEKRYIVLAPDGSDNPGLFYGNGETFHKAKTSKMLGPDWFYDPRHFNPRNNDGFRGHDLRVWSSVEFDKKKGECAVTCGTRTSKVKMMTGEAAMSVARDMNIEPDPLPFAPHALARDRRGTYYYVERGTKKGQERLFRLHVGKLGSLKLQKMRDIVSDSGGEIFSSRAGDLRLVIDRDDEEKSKATWIAGKRPRRLKMISIHKNLDLIYNKLGIYTGKPLGNPCDDYGL